MLFDPAADAATWTPDKLVKRRPAPPVVVRPESIRQREDAILAEARRILDARMTELHKQALRLATTNKGRANIILKQIAIEYGVTVHDIKGPWRPVHVCTARFAAYYRIRMETNLSYPSIGRLIGGRNHATIMHGAIKHADLHGLPRPGQRDASAEVVAR